MIFRYLCTFLSVSLLLFSCKNEPKQPETTAREELKIAINLPGKWETKSLLVTVNTFQDTDSSFTIDIKENEWAEKLGMKPFQTEYKSNNTYTFDTQEADGTPRESVRGFWNLFGDTLLMVEPDVTYQYLLTRIDNNKMELKNILDWDGDGTEDDVYICVQERTDGQ